MDSAVSSDASGVEHIKNISTADLDQALAPLVRWTRCPLFCILVTLVVSCCGAPAEHWRECGDGECGDGECEHWREYGDGECEHWREYGLAAAGAFLALKSQTRIAM